MSLTSLTPTIQSLASDFLPDTIDFCQRLIRRPSLPGSEKDVADAYLAEMEKLGYDEVFRDAWGNVIGLVRGTEPGPTIMYNAHLDHVDPGDLSAWEGYDPYGAAIDEAEMENQDRDALERTRVIHGRAAADTKAGGACQVYSGAMLLRMRAQGIPIRGNYLFTAVVLEEPAEQLGMIKLIDETLPARGIGFDGVVSCEATGLKLYLGHRGRVEIKVTTHGLSSHSSSPWLGINAVNKATRFIDRIEEVVARQARVDADVGRSSIALKYIDCEPGSMSIVPDRCNMIYDRRFIPGETADDCISQIQELIGTLEAGDPQFKATVAVAAETRTSYTGLSQKVANVKQAWKISPENVFVSRAADALQALGQPVKYGYWDFGTDLAVVCGRDGKPAIGYSPMQEFYCHRPVDKVRIDYMEKALAGYAMIHFHLAGLAQDDFQLS